MNSHIFTDITFASFKWIGQFKHLLITSKGNCQNISRELTIRWKLNYLIAGETMQFNNTLLCPYVSPDHHLGHDLFNSCHSRSLPFTRTQPARPTRGSPLLQPPSSAVWYSSRSPRLPSLPELGIKYSIPPQHLTHRHILRGTKFASQTTILFRSQLSRNGMLISLLFLPFRNWHDPAE